MEVRGLSDGIFCFPPKSKSLVYAETVLNDGQNIYYVGEFLSVNRPTQSRVENSGKQMAANLWREAFHVGIVRSFEKSSAAGPPGPRTLYV